jgi:Rho GTPase-activating protein 1
MGLNEKQKYSTHDELMKDIMSIMILTFIQYFQKVTERSDLNKMTSSNLAVVFGPNLLWSQSLNLSLSAIAPINMFTDFIIIHQDEIFLI